jgi:two-component system response regulator CiaR
MYKILLVEDDLNLARSICDFFESKLYQINHYSDGEKGYKVARTNIYDLILLDVMLPGKNGLVIANQLRRNHIETPILIISTKNLVDDIVNGFCYGIDGYLTKPFSLRELKARVGALLKRPPQNAKKVLKAGDLILNLENFQVKRNKQNISLRKKEFGILKYLVENQNKVVSKEQIMDNIWSLGNCDCSINNLDVHISSLRSKIDKGFESKMIQTKHGMGYSICSAKKEIENEG